MSRSENGPRKPWHDQDPTDQADGPAPQSWSWSGTDLSAWTFNAGIATAAKPSGGGGGGTGYTPPSSWTSGNPLVPDSQEFNLTLTFTGSGWTQALVTMAQNAANTISRIITGDIYDVTYLGQNIDDIAITISIGSIDRGGGGTFASNIVSQTQITAYRDGGPTEPNAIASQVFLPATATIKLDSWDLKASGGNLAGWDTMLLHEMTHAVGLAGPIIDMKGLYSDALVPMFIGPHANNAYQGGDFNTPAANVGFGIPVSLFDGSHWDELNFNPAINNDLIIGGALPDSQELMTTTFGSLTESAWLSDVTLGALVDLGYQVADVSPNAPGIRVSTLLA